MGRPKSTNKSVHTAIRLPESIHRRLLARTNLSLSDEIRTRLAESLNMDAVDDPSRQLFMALMHMIGIVYEEVGEDWYKHPFVVLALSEAISAWFKVDKGSRDASFAPKELARRSRLWLREGDRPEEAGANLLRLHNLVFDLGPRPWPRDDPPNIRKKNKGSK